MSQPLSGGDRKIKASSVTQPWSKFDSTTSEI